MRIAALIAWLVTASLDAFMLRTWLARGGLHRERAREGGLPPQLIFGHGGLALTGLLLWVCYLATGARPLAWTAIGLLMLTVGLGLCTVTLWTPYPARRPGERRAAPAWEVPVPVVPDTAATLDRPAQQDDQDLVPEITDEMIARLLTEPFPVQRHRQIRPNPEVLVPVVHGFGAISTFVLTVMAAIGR